MSRLDPIRPVGPRTEPVVAVHRTPRSDDRRGRRSSGDQAPPEREHDRPGRDDEAPDDGRPHIDVRA